MVTVGLRDSSNRIEHFNTANGWRKSENVLELTEDDESAGPSIAWLNWSFVLFVKRADK